MTTRSESLAIIEKYFAIRLIEKRIADEYPCGEIRCPTHLSLGQEVLPALLGSLMRVSDLAISSHRGHSHYLAKGGDRYRLVAELYGKVTGCSKGRGGSMHLVDLSVNFLGTTAIVANSIPVGVGAAAALKLRDEATKNLCFVFFGDGAVEEGVFAESLNIAVLQELPVIFICENNAFSVYTHQNDRQPRHRKIYEWARGFGIRTELIQLNDSNLEQSFAELREALNWARENRKPVFIEVPSWREVEHCGPNNDDHLAYRDLQEIARWGEVDQDSNIVRMGIRAGILQNEIEEIRESLLKSIDYIFCKVKQDPYELSKDILGSTYA